MGHSKTASYFIGRVSSPCVDDVILPPLDAPATCRLHNPIGSENRVDYKTMGHIYNVDFYKSLKGSHRQNHHAALCNPLVPILEFSGFTPSERSLGGPILNTQREIVGMVAGFGAESFAIPVTALRYIFEVFAPTEAANIKDYLATVQKKTEEKKRKRKRKAALQGSGLKK
ncbi:hypothetical protein POM88_038476 [Heracleum sosnowskyi]|uniref:Uncharacterized protein n=1 Tax=Heracleum sosnowskyi TaxID=360622 RepID=A0AAD8H8K7_9APIA|nr:hypothetical protein POM88_038476 [Heracleum sosnowskyi]